MNQLSTAAPCTFWGDAGPARSRSRVRAFKVDLFRKSPPLDYFVLTAPSGLPSSILRQIHCRLSRGGRDGNRIGYWHKQRHWIGDRRHGGSILSFFSGFGGRYAIFPTFGLNDFSR